MINPHAPTEELTREEMDLMLRKARYGRLGLAFENESYVVPISHFYDGQSIRFHVAREGKKTTYLQANPQACFEVDEWNERGWCSVICYGTVTLSDTVEAKRQFLEACGVAAPPDETLQQFKALVCTLSVEDMTGRRSAGYSA